MPKKTKKEKLMTDVRVSQGPTYTLPKLKEIRSRVTPETQRVQTVSHASSSAHITNHAQVAKDITKITFLSIAAFGIELLLYWVYQHQLG